MDGAYDTVKEDKSREKGESEMLTDREAQLARSISAKEVAAHNDFLSSVGPRYVAAEGEVRVMNYMADKFAQYGLDVVCEDFEALAFEPKSVELKMTAPVELELEAGAVFFSEPTPGVSGEVVYVGNGDDAGYEQQDVSGKIALVEIESSAPKGALYEDIARAARHGATAIVFVHYEPWIQVLMAESGHFGLDKRLLPIEPRPIPALGTRADHWHRAVRLAAGKPIHFSLKVDVASQPRMTQNVRAILKGSEQPDRKVLLIAHRDTVFSPGVSDNGSGQVIMLELARVLANQPCRRTVEFVSLGAGEVLGCVGSWNYVDRHRDELSQIDAVINLDAVGMGTHLRIVTEGYWADYGPLSTSGWLNDALTRAADDLNYSIAYTPCILGLSDATPFLHHGVPAAWLWKYDDPFWHSPLDDAAHVDPNSFKVTGEIVGLTVLRLANQD
jgi:aminopeptidase YwaD